MPVDRVKLIDELIRDECRGGKPELKMYPDSKGIPTIGIGHNLRDKGISNAVAFLIAHEDIDEVEAALTDHLPWWTKLDEVRQRVLVNMAFNMGVGPAPENPTGKLLTFVHTLALIETGDYDAAADHMVQSAWFKQVGVRAVRLVEAMRTGAMP